MSKAVNMIDKAGTRNKVLDDFALHGLVQNLSIMAIDPVTDSLLGVSINVEARKEDKEKSLDEVLEEYDDPRFKHIMTVLYYVNQRAGTVFQVFRSIFWSNFMVDLRSQFTVNFSVDISRL